MSTHDHDSNAQAKAEQEAFDAKLAARGLPVRAYVDNSWNKSPGISPVIAVKRGEAGYHPIHTRKTALEINQAEGVTRAQAQAMYAGSMFGWDSPGAHPNAYPELEEE